MSLLVNGLCYPISQYWICSISNIDSIGTDIIGSIYHVSYLKIEYNIRIYVFGVCRYLKPWPEVFRSILNLWAVHMRRLMPDDIYGFTNYGDNTCNYFSNYANVAILFSNRNVKKTAIWLVNNIQKHLNFKKLVP